MKNNFYYDKYDYFDLECIGSFVYVFEKEKKIESKLWCLYMCYNVCIKEFFFVVIGIEDDLVIFL